MIPLFFIVALLADPPAAPPSSDAGAPALVDLCGQAAGQAMVDVPADKPVGVYVEASTPELARTAQSLLVDALAHHGAKIVTPLAAASATEAEQKARAEGLEALVRVRVGLEGSDLTLAGDRIATWVNFWDGETPVRQLPSAAITCRTPTDAAALTLARVVLPSELHVAAPTPPPVHYGVSPLARVPARVVALALVDADGDGRPEIALLTPTEVLIARPDGEILYRHDHASLPESPHPSRDPTGGLVATAGVSGRRIAYAYSGQARGESLTMDAQGLHLAGLIDGTPLCTGPSGAWFADEVVGTNTFGPSVKSGATTHDLGRPLVSLRANPSPNDVSYVGVLPTGQVQPFGPGLNAIGLPLPASGEAAVADLDGDGVAEVVTSSASPVGPSDQVRILHLGQAAPLFQSEPFAGAVMASCAGDLDGDGKADIILAAWQPDGTTTLLRVGIRP